MLVSHGCNTRAPVLFPTGHEATCIFISAAVSRHVRKAAVNFCMRIRLNAFVIACKNRCDEVQEVLPDIFSRQQLYIIDQRLGGHSPCNDQVHVTTLGNDLKNDFGNASVTTMTSLGTGDLDWKGF